MDNTVIVAIVGGAFTIIGTVYVTRTSAKNTIFAKEMEKNKIEAEAKVEIVKSKAETELKRTDSLLSTQLTFIRDLQEENRNQRKEMTDTAASHRQELLQVRNRMNELEKLMSVCIEERGKFKLEMERNKSFYDTLETQFKSSNNYQAAQKRQKTINKKLKGRIDGEITEDSEPNS